MATSSEVPTRTNQPADVSENGPSNAMVISDKAGRSANASSVTTSVLQKVPASRAAACHAWARAADVWRQKDARGGTRRSSIALATTAVATDLRVESKGKRQDVCVIQRLQRLQIDNHAPGFGAPSAGGGGEPRGAESSVAAWSAVRAGDKAQRRAEAGVAGRRGAVGDGGGGRKGGRVGARQ